MAEILIVCFSRAGENYLNGEIVTLTEGNSACVAKCLQHLTGAELFMVEPCDPYPDDYAACTEVAKAELSDLSRPPLKTVLEDARPYSHVIFCGPCWWGTYPMCMFTALEHMQFTDQQIHVIVTHEGSGLGRAERDLKNLLPDLHFGQSLAIRGRDCARPEKILRPFVRRNFPDA